MDKLTDSIKGYPVLWTVGVVAASLGVFWVITQQKEKKAEQELAASVAKQKAAVAAAAARQPQKMKGKLPWAVGDVDMWGPDMNKKKL